MVAVPKKVAQTEGVETGEVVMVTTEGEGAMITEGEGTEDLVDGVGELEN